MAIERQQYVCVSCGYVFICEDKKETFNYTCLNNIPDDWQCPRCGASKEFLSKLV